MKENTASPAPARGRPITTCGTRSWRPPPSTSAGTAMKKTTVSDLAKAIGFSNLYLQVLRVETGDRRDDLRELPARNRNRRTVAEAERPTESCGACSRSLRKRACGCSSATASCTTSPRRPPPATGNRCRPMRRACSNCCRRCCRRAGKAAKFERKTPLDETASAIYLVMRPYLNPLLLQYNLDTTDAAPAQLSVCPQPRPVNRHPL